MKHLHHIVPKHMGGTDDPSNLIELTVEEHAEAHRVLYEKYGKWQDKVAWQGLAGLIGHDEVMREMWDARKGEGNHFYGMKHSEETKRKISEARKGKGTGPKNHGDKIKAFWADKVHANVGKDPWNKGKKGLQKNTPEQLAAKSHPIVFEGVEYPSVWEAHRQTGISRYKIKKAATYK